MRQQHGIEYKRWLSLNCVCGAILTFFGLIAPWSINAAMAANGSVTYTYDALGRVITASYDTGAIVIYTYDANGNRTEQVINVNTGTLCWTMLTGCTGGGSITWDAGLWG